jgi:seryl-tRNA synthetase
MIDIEHIRKNPNAYRYAIKAKRIDVDLDQLLEVDVRRRTLAREVTDLRTERNRLTELVARGEEGREANIALSRQVGGKLSECETILTELDATYDRLMTYMPGLPLAGVPEGADDSDNVELYKRSEVRAFDFRARDHVELARLNSFVNFEGARKAAGSRAYALIANGALLEMAVLRFAFDHVLAKSFVPVLPPLMVTHEAMYGTGYFPLGEENAYELAGTARYLTGTSEVGIMAMQADQIYDNLNEPLRFAGISTCFRREAGAAGRDTKGFYRVHQFQKVEQVVICQGDDDVSEREHFALLQNSEEILQALELPYRVVAVCTGDMGLGQVRKHDIETWMPSRNAYCETHSCSSFYEFQARRLKVQYRTDGKKKKYVHTLNNTAIASPRILIALLENHQNKDGTINVPVALRPYLGGREILGV